LVVFRLVRELAWLLALKPRAADELLADEGAEHRTIAIGCQPLGRARQRNVALVFVARRERRRAFL